MTKTSNLIIENRNGDFLISKRDAPMFSGKPFDPLVKFQENSDSYAENEWGQIRLYHSHASPSEQYLVLQFRGHQALTDGEAKRNIFATARLTLKELRTITEIAAELVGDDINTDQLELDRLRAEVQELKEKNMSLILAAKEREDALHFALEG